jgi:F-type H+-transporting ATPase subunit epsilon
MNLYLSIVSPEQQLFNGEITSVTLPGTIGIFTILPQHAPIVSSLIKGEIIYISKGEEYTLNIQSGFVELSNGTVSACVSL